MFLLSSGVFLWSIAHLLTRIAPAFRASLGNLGKGLVAIAILISVLMMVFGYQQVETTHFWGRNPAMVGINNLLMLLAVYLMVVSVVKSALANRVRHLQLSAVKAWAIAHLMVNGDTASFILFGGLLAWAVISVILINKAGKPELEKRPTNLLRELISAVVTALLFGAIAMVHMKLGYPVFG